MPGTPTAVVTGAAGVLGRAIAARLAADGHAVVLTDIRAEALDRAAAAVTGRARTVEADIRTPAGIDAVAAAVEGDGPVVLVNNAGTLNDRRPSLELDRAEWDRVLDTNLHGGIALARALLPAMRQHGGSIVFLSSVASTLCREGEGPYSVSKAAIEALTRNLAAELGPDGIRVNAVAPGLISSPFLEKHADRYADEVGRTPLRRFGRPEEVASVISFLASDDAAFVTGAVVNVSGGWRLP